MMKMTSVEFAVMTGALQHSPLVFEDSALWLEPRVVVAVGILLPLGLFCSVIAGMHDTSERK